MSSDKTLGQIAYEAHQGDMGVWDRCAFKTLWEAVASAVRLAVIEECAKIVDEQSQTYSKDAGEIWIANRSAEAILRLGHRKITLTKNC